MRQAHIVTAGVAADPNATGTEVPDAIETAIDTLTNGVLGYETLAEEVDSATLRSLFRTFATERKATTEDLLRAASDERAAFDADTDGTVPGAIHRSWLKVEAALAGDEAVVASVMSAEDRATSELGKALDADLPEQLEAAIRKAIAEVNSVKGRLSEWQQQVAS